MIIIINVTGTATKKNASFRTADIPQTGNYVLFLGSGGGRVVVLRQLRATGGFRMRLDGVNFHFDPGPGALVACARRKVSPATDAIIVSHAHIDHYLDVPAIIEASTEGMSENKRGTKPALFCSTSYIAQELLDAYHAKGLSSINELRGGDSTRFKGISIEAFSTKHTDPDGIALRLTTSKRLRISYISDTEFFPGLFGMECDVLILSLLKPGGETLKGHASTNEVIPLIKRLGPPRLSFLTHFGLGMLQAGPDAEARRIQNEAGCIVRAVRDGMLVNIDEELSKKRIDGFG